MKKTINPPRPSTKVNDLKKGYVETKTETSVHFQVLERGDEGLWWQLGGSAESVKQVAPFTKALPPSRHGRRLVKVSITVTRRTEVVRELK